MRKTIVISAVNIRKGGTLTILRECLSYLSGLTDEWNIVALVHDRSLCEYPGIDYIEMPSTIKSWGRRLWCEYVTMGGISRELAAQYGSKVYLWLSLHDTTPRVDAEHRAVYCQTSFPFLKWHLRDLRMDPKIPLFALFTKYAYRINVHSNDWLIVQAQWLREGLGKMLSFSKERIIVAPVKASLNEDYGNGACDEVFTFLYPASADCHKNFETLCEAARLLEAEIGTGKFRVLLTIGGEENRYAQWLKAQWGNVKSISWQGKMSRQELFSCYGSSDCLVFPSRVETWGLPISEFLPTGKPMIVSDLPFAHETTAGAEKVVYFDSCSPAALLKEMKKVLSNDLTSALPNPAKSIDDPVARNWKEMFDYLLA